MRVTVDQKRTYPKMIMADPSAILSKIVKVGCSLSIMCVFLAGIVHKIGRHDDAAEWISMAALLFLSIFLISLAAFIAREMLRKRKKTIEVDLSKLPRSKQSTH